MSFDWRLCARAFSTSHRNHVSCAGVFHASLCRFCLAKSKRLSESLCKHLKQRHGVALGIKH